MAFNNKQALEKLYIFRSIDKYATFSEAQPCIKHTADDQKDTITDILDTCCKNLIIEIESTKRPTKASLKQIIITGMTAIATAPVNTANRDFGYHLCWFLADKAGLDLWKSSGTKVWGYWDVVDTSVKTVTRVRKVKSKV